MVKRVCKNTVLAFAVSAVLALSGCRTGFGRYDYTFIGAFDTVIRIVAYTDSRQAFDEMTEVIEQRMRRLNKLYDIYNSYDGINNAKTINDNAGISPVKVDEELLDLIEFSIDWYDKTKNTVNIAMGAVLSIWHDYREEGIKVPSMDELESAFALCNISDIIIDREKNTVFLKKKGMKLDFGATAKGYAASLAVEGFSEVPLLLSSGGNILACAKPEDRDYWNIGIQDPDANPLIPEDNPLMVIRVEKGCVVTSGDYQRYYIAENGERLCHIVDPSTLWPVSQYRSVSVICPDSGAADALSTALYILPYQEGFDLITSLGYDAIWIFPDKSVKMTSGVIVNKS